MDAAIPTHAAAQVSDLAAVLPALAEPLGVAVLFALAIWSGARLAVAVIDAARQVELARIAVQASLAAAIQAQAAAGAEQAASVREVRTQVGALEIVVQRLIQITERGQS